MSEQIHIRHPSDPYKFIKPPMIYNDDRCVDITKPAKISCKIGEFSILQQMYENLKKSYVQNPDFEHPDIIYGMEDGMRGIIILAKNRESAKVLKNTYGSYLFDFLFDLFCAQSTCDRESELVCSLPIAQHTSKEIMLISAKTGRKSCISFNFIGNVGKYEHWQAKCSYLRRDQMCLHAHESGLAILVDGVYGNAKIPLFTDLKRNFKANRKANNESSYSSIMAHLCTLKLHDGTVIRS
jgi:23S rRNA pseudouridine955/2504/2580 synthase